MDVSAVGVVMDSGMGVLLWVWFGAGLGRRFRVGGGIET